MIINNQIIHSHEIIPFLANAHRGYEIMPEKTYRIKLNGEFVRINNKSEWDKISSAKSAFRAMLSRCDWYIDKGINGTTPHHSNNYYRVDSSDLKTIFEQLITDKLLEFVEIKK